MDNRQKPKRKGYKQEINKIRKINENQKKTKNRPKNTIFAPSLKRRKKRLKTPNLSNPRHLTSPTCNSYKSLKTPFITFKNHQKTPKNDQKSPKNTKNVKNRKNTKSVKFGGSPGGPPGPRKKRRH